MKSWSTILYCAVLSATAIWSLAAQEHTRASGKVLLLDNHHAIQGEIQQRGDTYVVRRDGGEMTIPAGKVLAVCDSLEHAFKILSSQANLRDVHERLRLAKWCHANGLTSAAAAEAQAALELSPSNVDANKLMTALKRELTPTRSDPPTSYDETNELRELLDVASVEVSADCLAMFSTKVHAILLNTCAGCHASGKGGAFSLTRPTEINGKRALQANLASAVKLICFERPGQSPLLQKACMAHGGADTAPIANQQLQPFKTLQSWAELVASRNPHLRTHGAAPALVPQVLSADASPKQQFGVDTASFSVVQGPPNTVEMKDTVPPARVVPTETSLGGVTVPTRPLAGSTPENWQPVSEFDPMIFNRQWHPGR